MCSCWVPRGHSTNKLNTSHSPEPFQVLTQISQIWTEVNTELCHSLDADLALSTLELSTKFYNI